jgi:hypothetical protein
MNMKLNTVLAALIAAAAIPAFAQTATPGVDQRQVNQEARIQQGVKSGNLTEREATRLEKGQDRIERMEDKARADGKVTAKERRRLEHAQNVESRHIAREKHDRQRDRDHDGKNDRHERRHDRRHNG